jgi:hypothetical protein
MVVVPTDAPPQGSAVLNEAPHPHRQDVAPSAPSEVFRSIPPVTVMVLTFEAPGRMFS